jgi:hypothetical protein
LAQDTRQGDTRFQWQPDQQEKQKAADYFAEDLKSDVDRGFDISLK